MEKHSNKKTKNQRQGSTQQADTPYSRLYLIEDCVMGLLFLSVLLLFSTGVSVHFTLPKLIGLRIGTLFLAGLWIYRIRKREVQPVPQFILFSGIGLGIWWIFSTFFALHTYTAMHGVYGRYNGLFTHALWLILFFVFATLPASTKRTERILNLFIVSLVPVALYAIAQFYNIDPMPWISLKGRSASTIGHPVMLSALMGLALPFVVTFLFQKKTLVQRISYGLICLIFIFTALSTLSRGPLIGIVLSSIFIIAMNVKDKKVLQNRRVVFAIISFVILLSTLFVVHSGSKDILNRLKSSEEIEIRLIYFKTASNIIRDHLFAGVGFENFRIIYPQYRMAEENRIALDVLPTMVHNGYLQSAVTNGIFALILYIILIVSIMISLVRACVSKDDQYRAILLWTFVASIGGFLIQDLSGWLEISQTTFFWIILGIAVSYSQHGQQKNILTGTRLRTLYVTVTACCVFLSYLSLEAINRTWADSIIWETKVYNKDIAKKEIELPLTDALETLNGDFYYEDFAGLLYANKYNEAGDERFYKKARDLFERAYSHNPYDVYVLLHRIQLETLAIRKGLVKKASPFVKNAAHNVGIMDKNNPSVYDTLVIMKMAEGDIDDALYMLERRRLLASESSKFYLIEGDVYQELKNYPKAIHAYNKAVDQSEKERLAMTLIRRGSPRLPEWISAKYGLIHSFVRTKDYLNALKEIQEVIGYFPHDPQPYIMMGDIYGFMGSIERAKQSFEQALKRDPNNPFAQRGIMQCNEVLQRKQQRLVK